MPLRGSTRALLLNITRWEKELSTGEARGTLLSGVAGKAANGFENLLRQRLAQLLAVSDLTYESELASDFHGKSLQKLTMGEVIQSLDKLGGKLSRLLGKDLLLRKGHKSRLAEITALRNLLHHHFEERFARDEADLVSNTGRLLSLVREELSEPLFQADAAEL